MGVRIIEESYTIILEGEINDEVASEVCFAILTLESKEPWSVITLMINSPGGDVIAGWRIIDTMTLVQCVETICIGQACSMAAVILMSGAHGKRSALPHSRIMLHQPMVGTSLMKSGDFENAALELTRSKKELYDHISKCTGKQINEVAADCERDNWMTPLDAVKYGIIDEVITPENRGIYPAGNV